jgi:hypothetical protein
LSVVATSPTRFTEHGPGIRVPRVAPFSITVTFTPARQQQVQRDARRAFSASRHGSWNLGLGVGANNASPVNVLGEFVRRHQAVGFGVCPGATRAAGGGAIPYLTAELLEGLLGKVIGLMRRACYVGVTHG